MAKRNIKKALEVLTRVSKPALKIRTSYASCTIYSSWPMVCPLCHDAIPANTEHTCQREMK